MILYESAHYRIWRMNSQRFDSERLLPVVASLCAIPPCSTRTFTLSRLSMRYWRSCSWYPLRITVNIPFWRQLKYLHSLTLDANIRSTVLSELEERFDRHLSQPEHIRLLFMAMNDEAYDVRFKAVTIIGRLGDYNPAHVMPSLRKTLIQLLTEIEYASMPYGTLLLVGIR